MAVDELKIYCRLKPASERKIRCFIPIDEHRILLIEDKKTLTFKLKKVFDENVTQDSIFAEVGLPAIKDLFNGKSGIVLTNGFSSSGKNFTYHGTLEKMGIVPLCIKNVFKTLQNKKMSIFISFLEFEDVYIKDLINGEILNRKKTLELLQTPLAFLDAVQTEVQTDEESLTIFWRALKQSKKCPEKTSCLMPHLAFIIRLVEYAPDKSAAEKAQNIGTSTLLTCINLNFADEKGALNDSTLQAVKSCIQSAYKVQREKKKVVPFHRSRLTLLLGPIMKSNGALRSIICIDPYEDAYKTCVELLDFWDVPQSAECYKSDGLDLVKIYTGSDDFDKLNSTENANIHCQQSSSTEVKSKHGGVSEKEEDNLYSVDEFIPQGQPEDKIYEENLSLKEELITAQEENKSLLKKIHFYKGLLNAKEDELKEIHCKLQQYEEEIFRKDVAISEEKLASEWSKSPSREINVPPSELFTSSFETSTQPTLNARCEQNAENCVSESSYFKSSCSTVPSRNAQIFLPKFSKHSRFPSFLFAKQQKYKCVYHNPFEKNKDFLPENIPYDKNRKVVSTVKIKDFKGTSKYSVDLKCCKSNGEEEIKVFCGDVTRSKSGGSHVVFSDFRTESIRHQKLKTDQKERVSSKELQERCNISIGCSGIKNKKLDDKKKKKEKKTWLF